MRNQHAFTLIEVLVALSIMITMTALSISGLQYFLRRGQDEAVRDNLMRLIESARTESGINNLPVVLCSSNDQKTCSGRWSDGQLTFINQNQDGVVQDSETIISINQMNLFGGQLRAKSFPMHRNYLILMPPGYTSNDNGTIWFCHRNTNNPVWAIKVNHFGQTRIVLPNKNGVIKDGRGKVLLC